MSRAHRIVIKCIAAVLLPAAGVSFLLADNLTTSEVLFGVAAFVAAGMFLFLSAPYVVPERRQGPADEEASPSLDKVTS